MTADHITDTIAQEAVQERAMVIDLLPEYKALTKAVNDAKKRQQALRDRIVQFMELEEETVLHDGEHGITVRLKSKAGTTEYDIASLAGRSPEVIGRLALIPGMLRAKHSVVKALGDASMDLAELRKVAVPGKGSVSLVIDEEK